ncbi:peptide/nickel transport system permease protein/oligopeptide transport system permease protein [Pseudonocardia thermophila]|jgi:ABC-type dipeptide/oligopeptide/nickel transport systems, permease components|uniref:Peptide/nickel transport system permease protein/oligopeptide transport system permease protein n=1 Tax=Pseudonocardia thermophila TaxID=1848 RepID=A0A1M6T424_PSETH|nr:ABC transporter permease [Pseudonocardia thermophila]SHK51711.1 peptide/nickel transport system permease protein/oligopeptide transport system permease protein [Pseudonocardia thermophila]
MTVATAPQGSARRALAPGLLRYVVVRVVSAVCVMFAVSIVVFLFIHAAPGGPEHAIGGELATEEQLESIRQRYGFDRPLPEQYLQFLGGILHGDFGESIIQKTPVATLIGETVKVTLPLLAFTWILAMGAGLALGILTASRPGSRLDRFSLGMTTLGASTPAFVVGTFLAWLFGVQLGWFPALGAGEGGLDTVRHLVLPAATAAIVLLAVTTRITRVRVGQILEEDQATFARARGLGRWWTLKHVVLRNAGVQLVTLSGSVVVSLFTGLILVERVFNLPGIGSLMVDAIHDRDMPVIQGVTFCVALLVVTVNLVVDLVCMAIDPRLRARLETNR